MKFIRAFFSSTTAHMFFLLLGGMTAAALIAGTISSFSSSLVFQRQGDERTADRLQAFTSFLDAAPAEFRARLLRRNESGVVSHPLDTPGVEPDPTFTRVLTVRGGILAAATVEKAAWAAAIVSMARRSPQRWAAGHAQFTSGATSGNGSGRIQVCPRRLPADFRDTE
jgi:hypothetical protein